MATALSNLSDVKISDVPSAEKMKFGIVVAEWNYEITEALFEGANYTLQKNDAKSTNIIKKYVPGSFELTLGGQTLAEYTDVDAIILLGCVIKGETPHFDYICQGVTNGITQLNIQYNLPFIFGVLTTYDKQQALDRAGGKYGNKGDEAAITAIKMVEMQRQLR